MMGFAHSKTGSMPACCRSAVRGPVHQVLALLFVGLIASGCAQTKSFVHESAEARPSGTARVLLLEPDIELSELTAGGLLVPNAAWTDAGRRHVDTALKELMAESNAEIVHYEPLDDLTAEHPQAQLIKLHGAVGLTILFHQYNQAFALPTKKDKFDWTLGPAVQVLRQEYDADYALFVYLRDSFATSGRVALIIVGAIFGVGVPGGVQVGFASLVDLETGDIVWFNRLVSEVGDLRERDSARDATENLLDDLPL